MEISTHYSVKVLKIRRKSFAIWLPLVVTLLSFQNSVAQVYATAQSSGNFDCAVGCSGSGVTDGPDAIDGDLTTKSLLISNKAVGGIFGGSAFQTLRFATGSNPVPAQQTIYIKIDQPTSSGLVTGILGFVGLTGTNITAELKRSNTNDDNGTAITASVRIVTDASGANYFLAVTPNASNALDFNAVRIEVTAPFLDVFSSVGLNIYEAFYYSSAESDCGLPIYSSFGEQTGLSVSLFDAIDNPQNAIDGDLTTSSQLGSALANVGLFSTLSQTIFFKEPSAATDQAVIYLSTNNQVLDVGLFGGLSVQAFNGANPAGTSQSLSSLLDIELLGFDLISGIPDGTLIPFFYTPTAPFDRIVVTLNSGLVDLALFDGGINIHDISQVTQKPTITSHIVYQFAGATPQVTASTTDGSPIFWQGPLPARTNLTASAVASAAPFPVAVNENGDYVAVSVKTGCTVNASDSTKLRVIVLTDVSNTPSGQVSSAYLGSIAATSSGNTVTYSTPANLPPGLVFNTTTGAITGTPTESGTTIVTVNIFVNGVPSGLSLTKSIIIESSLPVTLTRFSATKEGKTALLSWATTSESNSQRFDVERSGNGKGWTIIGTEGAKGESTILQNYSYTDNLTLNGENLYRLKMIDFDGTFAYSSIVSLNFDRIATGLYPNPVAGTENLNLDINDWNKVKSVQVINAVGEKVFESKSAVSQIETQKLISGLYFVKVVNNDGSISTYKFVKL